MREMKNRILLIIALALMVTVGCKKDDIMLFDLDDPGVQFPGLGDGATYKGYNSGNKTYYISESFINVPLTQDLYIVDFPIKVSGDSSETDRAVSYKIIADETTATQDQYSIVEAVIPKGKQYGYIRFELKRNPALDEQMVAVAIELTDSKDLKVGSNEYKKGILQWSNMLPMFPMSSFYTRTYNMLILTPLSKLSTSVSYYSPNAHKAVIDALQWPVTYWPRYSNSLADPSTGTSTILGAYYTDLYAQKLKAYLDAYETANGSRLKHNAGTDNGKEIQARVSGAVYIP